MNKFFSILLAAIFLFSAHSATALNMADSKKIVRFEVGLNYPTGSESLYENSVAFSGIFAYRLVFNRWLYLEPGIGIGGFKQKISGQGGIENRYNYDAHTSYFGATVPVYLGITLIRSNDFGLSVFTGPRLFIGAPSRVKGTAFYEPRKQEHEIDTRPTNSGLDASWNAGLDIEFKNVHLGVDGGLGLMRCFGAELVGYPEGETVNYKRRYVAISVGYAF